MRGGLSWPLDKHRRSGQTTKTISWLAKRSYPFVRLLWHVRGTRSLTSSARWANERGGASDERPNGSRAVDGTDCSPSHRRVSTQAARTTSPKARSCPRREARSRRLVGCRADRALIH